MKLRREEIAKMAGLILKNLNSHALIVAKVPEAEVLARIEAAILKNMEEEAAIEEEVKKIMERYRAQIASGSIDPQRAYMMIKKQVAKDRKFIL